MQLITTLPALPVREPTAHKGTFGSLLILGGRPGMAGAAVLAGLGGLRGGAGLVRVAVPEPVAAVVASQEPSYLTVALPADGDGGISAEAQPVIAALLANQTAVAVGPGLGTSEGPRTWLPWLLETAVCPLVLDADALNILAAVRPTARGALENRLGRSGFPRVVTPHPKEFGRLTGWTTETIQADRVGTAGRFARERGVVVVLKGAGTVITDGDRYAVNLTGNAGMATGGTGDVLTGLVGALLAQGMEPFDAARLAAHLHGLAGDMAAAELSQPGLIASDLPHYLGRAWRSLGA